jgi:tRNA nucleotidyltransferase (CCA-adding enzyme)
VRDAFLDRRGDYLDLDFVVPEQAVEVARRIARSHEAGFVVLDVERQIARIVFPQATVDFALQEGPTLEADLRRRDFTVNAMAYDPRTQALIDPLGGFHDLQQRCLRMVAAENLQADPLRLLRAYRQAAQLNFDLDPPTDQWIRHLSPHIAQVAAERVQSELSYLLHHPQGVPWLVRACQAGLLRPWLPDVTSLHLERLQKLDPLLDILSQRWPQLLGALHPPLKSKENLTKPEGLGRSLLGFLRLCLLLHPERAETTLKGLKASRWEVRSVALLFRLMPQLQSSPLSIPEQYFLYKEAQDLCPVLALLALLHHLDPETPGLESLWVILDGGPIAPSLDQFFDLHNPIAHPQTLITGKEVMQHLHLPSGPKIGKILTAVQLAFAQGQIHTPAEALAFAQQWLQQSSS